MCDRTEEREMKKVVKFGGSSLASAEQFKKVGEIIRADKERRFVVPSAPGKRYIDDTKVTDMLYTCYDLAEAGKDFRVQLKEIKDRYQEIIDGLELKLSLEEEFKTIEKNFKNKSGSNYAASRGEYLNGIIMAAYLGFTFVDAAEVIYFDENGECDAEITNQKMWERLEKLDGAQLKRELLKYKGVGGKVADCIALFGFGKTDSFPVDTWLEKVYREDFGGQLKDRDKITKFFTDKFGEYSGYMQQYLFYGKRLNL